MAIVCANIGLFARWLIKRCSVVVVFDFEFFVIEFFERRSVMITIAYNELFRIGFFNEGWSVAIVVLDIELFANRFHEGHGFIAFSLRRNSFISSNRDGYTVSGLARGLEAWNLYVLVEPGLLLCPVLFI